MARITIMSTFLPRWKSPVTSGIRTAMAWRCGGPCPHDAVVKNVATTTSPTSSSKQFSQAIRDLNLWEQPCFGFTKLPSIAVRVQHRQHIIPPFKAKDVSYTYRFEQFVLRSLIGSTAEEVAHGLGISAETVDRIVENQSTEDRQIDPQRVITDIGLMIELEEAASARRDVNDRSEDPTRPQILVVERGRDTTAALKCLDGSRRNNANRSAPIGSTWAGLSGGVRLEVAPQPCRDGSVPCG